MRIRGARLGSLRLFTPRALGFVSCAVALYLAGLATGVSELYMLAVAGITLPAGAWLIVRMGTQRVAATRTVRPLRVANGERSAVELELVNHGRLETGVLLVSERVPYQLGLQPRFVVAGIPGGATERLSYTLTGTARGRYPVGPLMLRLADPFGLAQVTSEVAGVAELIVHPKVEPLSPPPFGGDLAAAPVARRMRLDASGDEFYTTRTYRDGDDLRKVHWRSSAKRGELMIRQDESPRHARAVIAADLRRGVHMGDEELGSFERSVEAAASIAVRLAGYGYELSCATDDGHEVRPPKQSDPAVPVLDFLASVQPSRGESLAPLVNRLSASTGGLLVAVLTLPSAADAAVLARCRMRFDAAYALLVRPDTFLATSTTRSPRTAAEGEAHAAGAAGLLERAGWRTAVLCAGEPLDESWRRLVRGRAGTGPPVGRPVAGSGGVRG
jgi:uncharacterized protein (DUF58 family)